MYYYYEQSPNNVGLLIGNGVCHQYLEVEYKRNTQTDSASVVRELAGFTNPHTYTHRGLYCNLFNYIFHSNKNKTKYTFKKLWIFIELFYFFNIVSIFSFFPTFSTRNKYQMIKIKSTIPDRQRTYIFFHNFNPLISYWNYELII